MGAVLCLWRGPSPAPKPDPDVTSRNALRLELGQPNGAAQPPDGPRSICTGQSLDEFDPANVLNMAVTMRGWQPQAGIVFKGKRVDLTLRDIQEYEGEREGRDNPHGKRFWGPRGPLRVRYNSSNGRVDPHGNATVMLSESDRELGDEADAIGADGKAIDVKTMAFVLLVQGGGRWRRTARRSAGLRCCGARGCSMRMGRRRGGAGEV